MSARTLLLDSISLTNFRCFATCTLPLHPYLTMLVAENGRGKSALLDAVALSLGLLVNTISERKESPGFLRHDIRRALTTDGRMLDSLPTSLAAVGVVDGQSIEWSRSLRGAGERARTTTADARQLIRASAQLRDRLRAFAEATVTPAPPLPIIAYYGTGRLWGESRLTARARRVDSSALGRRGAYIQCLSPLSSFPMFEHWYKTAATAARSPTSVALSPAERPEKMLAAVRRAVDIVLEPTGWHDLDWDFDESRLVITHSTEGRLPLGYLSDGVQNTIALVGDLAHRCVRLNPHFGQEAARLTPGIVLIDEIDMHLHPGWQQRIVEAFRRAFPQLQLIATTHSPAVLSTVDSESIRVVRWVDGSAKFETPALQTMGVESSDILAKVMGVHPSPPVAQAAWLSEYRALLQQDAHESLRGMEVWGRLCAHFGERHPVLTDLEPLRHLAHFKRKHGVSQKGR
jgi:predicted ATP-binding protein involved in virulence